MINFTLFAPLLAVTQNLGLPRATPLWRISGLHREVTLQYFQKLCQLRWLAEPRSTIFGERNTVCCQNFLQLSNPSQLALDFSLRFVEVCHRLAFHLVVASPLQRQFTARLIAKTRTITTPASDTRTCTTPPWPAPSVTGSSTTPTRSRSMASLCAITRGSPNNRFTYGGRVHHVRGRRAPSIRNGCTTHAVSMHHRPRSCCSLGAAYAQRARAVLQNRAPVLHLSTAASAVPP